MAEPLFVRAFRLLPSNLISWLVGFLARIQLWRPLQKLFNECFAGAFRIDMSTSEQSVAECRSIEDVFTRRLKPGMRPISGSLCSPADGKLVIAERCQNGMAIQAKGIPFSVEQLISGDDRSLLDQNLKFDRYFTVYLAPHNYHRVHSPLDGRISWISHIPGKLWPVNDRFVKVVPRLFLANERMTFALEPRCGGKAWVVMVGAFNVGRIAAAAWPNHETNGFNRQLSSVQSTIFSKSEVSMGQELGTFMLGSTVVVVLDSECSAALGDFSTGYPSDVVMGGRII